MTSPTTPTSTTLLRGGRIRTPAHPHATAMVVHGGRVAWVGADDAPEAASSYDDVVELAGAFVAPAFVDAHVHATMTGHQIDSLDLSGARSVTDVLDLVARHDRSAGARVVLGMAWDESGWPEQRPPTADELDRAGGGAAVYLTRVDGHSAAVSAALLAAVPAARGAAGWSDSGWVRQAAHHHVRHAVAALVPASQRRAAQRSALRRAVEVGVGCVHECGGPDIGGEDDLRGLLDLAATGGDDGGLPDVLAYWGETAAAGGLRRVTALGAVGAAGDLFVDGALGSRTAALRAPYTDAPDGAGALYLEAHEVADHLVACTRAGVQGGFHVIGDRAHDAVVEGLALAAAEVGADALRAARHRLEHVEMPDERAIAALAQAGVVASMQPVFDALWGGTGRLYEARLGPHRAPGMNPFGVLAAAGVPLAFGSDSPVTPLGPWAAVRAAVHHHDEPCRLDPAAAFAAHTAGGWYAARRDADGAGTLVPGAPATYAVWQTGPLDAHGLPDLAPGAPDPTCLRTAVRGRTVYEAQEALR